MGTMPPIPGTMPDLNSLVGPGGQQPTPPGAYDQALAQQAGLFQQLQQFHQALISGRDLLMSIAQQNPAASEDVRTAMMGLDAVISSMAGLVVSMTSQAPEPPVQGPQTLG